MIGHSGRTDEEKLKYSLFGDDECMMSWNFSYFVSYYHHKFIALNLYITRYCIFLIKSNFH